MEIFRFAILGAANIANKFCDAVARIPGCEVVAVASKSMGRAKNFAQRNKVPHVYADYREMLDAEKPDCAYIAVTVNDHYRLTTFLLGQKVKNMTATASWSESGVDITNHIAISFEHTLASLMASFVSKMEERMVLYGQEGKIILPSPHFGAECFLYDGQGTLVEHFKDEKTQNGFTYEIEEAVTCVRAGKLESSVIPHTDTIACAKMFDMIEATRSKQS